VIKQPHPPHANEMVHTTRIHFHTPRAFEFDNGHDLKGTWRFWERHQAVKLSIAAFQYQGGKRGASYFGADLELDISSKSASVSAELVFAMVFYLLAAATVPAVTSQPARQAPSSPAPSARSSNRPTTVTPSAWAGSMLRRQKWITRPAWGNC
ncbi:MAG: hypothetical protein ABW202_11620, partial [Duganella sp.]